MTSGDGTPGSEGSEVEPDAIVSTMLRKLPVPEHRPGFWEHLEAQLDTTPGLPVRPLVAPAPVRVRSAPPVQHAPVSHAPVSQAPVPQPLLPAGIRRGSNVALSVLAAAAAVVAVVAGVTLVRDDSRPGLDAAGPSAGSAEGDDPPKEFTGTTAAPALPAPAGVPAPAPLETVPDEPTTPEDAAATFVAAVNEGSTERAWGLLGRVSQRSWGDPTAFAGSASELAGGAYGMFRTAVDLDVSLIPVQGGGRKAGVVVLDGVIDLDGVRARQTLELPYRGEGGALRLDPWAPGSGAESPIQFTSPVPVDGAPVHYGTVLEIDPSVGVEALLPRWATVAVMTVDGYRVERVTFDGAADRIVRFDPEVPFAPGVHRVTVAAAGGSRLTAASVLLKAR
jgi:hypothetical protein